MQLRPVFWVGVGGHRVPSLYSIDVAIVYLIAIFLVAASQYAVPNLSANIFQNSVSMVSMKHRLTRNPEIKHISKYISFVTAFILFFAVTPLGYSATSNDTAMDSKQIVKHLQQGGLVVYFRHAATDRTQEDRHPVDLRNCDTQRNLSDQGRFQAEEIGAAFKRLAIPVSEVLSSPFCRCRDTAKFAFGKHTVNENLYFAVALNKEQRAAQTTVLQMLIADKPKSGNRIIVSHTGNLREATGLWPKPEGAAYIFEPRGNGQYRMLGLIKPDEWIQL